MHNAKRIFFNKIIKTASTLLVTLVFFFGNFAPAFAGVGLQIGSTDGNNPDAQELSQEIFEDFPITDVESDLAYIESLTPAETLIDKERLHFFSLTMPQLEDRERNIIVYLPSDYQTGNNSYPVIYVLDAQNLFVQSGFSPDDRIMKESLFQFYTHGFTHEAIIVGIEYDQIHMWDEYSPWVNQNMYLWMDPYEANQVEGGEGDAFLDFMIETVKPVIDESYRTLTARENTSIGGSRMGGLLSVYAGLTKPEIFSKVMAMSPAVWFAESGETWLSDNQLIKFVELNGVPFDVKFYLDVTNEERITDLVVRPAVSNSNGYQITFPQAYLEGLQSLVDEMVETGLPISSIIGGVENPTEWTKKLTESPNIILGDGNFLTYLPLLMNPAIPPLITSAASATFTKSNQSSFTVTTTGLPTPTISYTGTLPAGVSFIDNGNGTATIAGTANVTGTYNLTITAQNGVEPNAIQDFTLKVVEGCPDSGSCLITFSTSMSPYLDRTRNISVYLPPNYNSGDYYPVIYLMDAQHMFGFPIAHPADLDDWKMDEKLDSYYDSYGRGVIAVGIWFDFNYPWDEYTLSANLNMDHWVSGASQLTTPEGGGMIAFIKDKLKPEIDSRFHTLTDRTNTAIGGGSRCALLALHAGLHAPETFSRVMAFSPAVWIAESKYEDHVPLPGLTTWYLENGLQWWFTHYQAPTNVKYFLYIGTNEQTGILSPYVQKSTAPGVQISIQYAYESGYVRVSGALISEGVPDANLRFIRNVGGTHHPSVWRAYIIPNVLPFFGY